MFGTLADEIWCNIISFLSLKDIASLTLVSKRFSKLCKDKYTWKQLFLQHYQITDNEELQQDITRDFYEFYKQIRLEIPRKKEISLDCHIDEVLHGIWSHNGLYFASASRDCKVNIFTNENLNTGNPKFSIQHYGNVGRVGFSMDDKFLFTSTVATLDALDNLGATVRVFSVDSGDMIYSFMSVNFDSYPCWISENRILFTSGFVSRGTDLAQSQTFTIAECHESSSLRVPPPVFHFSLEYEFNHYHLSSFGNNNFAR